MCYRISVPWEFNGLSDWVLEYHCPRSGIQCHLTVWTLHQSTSLYENGTMLCWHQYCWIMIVIRYAYVFRLYVHFIRVIVSVWKWYDMSSSLLRLLLVVIRDGIISVRSNGWTRTLLFLNWHLSERWYAIVESIGLCFAAMDIIVWNILCVHYICE
jgi:hypothetical protein